MIDLMLALEETLERIGWGQPARLYTIEGTREEPEFKAFAELTGNPREVLHTMREDGVQVPEAIGLVIVAEGYRHLKIEEVEKDHPDLYAKLLTVANEEERGDEVQTLIQNGWQDMCRDVSPANMPPHMQIEVRNSVAVMDDGWSLYVIRDKGAEPEVLEPVPPVNLHQSAVPELMWKFLTGNN